MPSLRLPRRLVVLATLAVAALSAAAPTARAQRLDLETDPLAYLGQGASLHIGLRGESSRLVLGLYGLEIPSWATGNDGLSNRIGGGGLTYDLLPTGGRRGLYWGVSTDWTRNRYGSTLAGGPATPSVVRSGWNVGTRLGYRIPLGDAGFYLAPWVGVSYAFDHDDVPVGTQVFRRQAITVFPTVHLGWRF